MKMWEFATAGRIVFGSGSATRLPEFLVADSPTVIVTGAHSTKMDIASHVLQAGSSIEVIRVTDEPTLDIVEEGICLARKMECKNVVGIGGGSVMDTAKAISALAVNNGELADYLEVIGPGKPINQKGVNCVVLPTTAGTGSEVTKNAVIKLPDLGVKVSLRGTGLLPNTAIVDPELTLSLPPDVTANTGMDALTQLVESYVSKKSNPLTDSMALSGIKSAAMSLLDVYRDGANLTAREGMSYASLVSGLCLANSGLGAVHGFAAVIGGMYSMPHGEICAALLSAVCQINIKAARNRGLHEVLDKYGEVARVVTRSRNGSVDDLIKWLGSLTAQLGIKPLGDLGLHNTDFSTICERAKLASSMKGNPIELSDSELMEILEYSY